MSLLSKLFGGGGGGSERKPEAQPEEHNGYRIYPEPAKAPGGFRVGARIEKDVEGGEALTHSLIRADIFDSEDTARDMSTRKAKMLIDQMGDRLFEAPKP